MTRFFSARGKIGDESGGRFVADLALIINTRPFVNLEPARFAFPAGEE